MGDFTEAPALFPNGLQIIGSKNCHFCLEHTRHSEKTLNEYSVPAVCIRHVVASLSGRRTPSPLLPHSSYLGTSSCSPFSPVLKLCVGHDLLPSPARCTSLPSFYISFPLGICQFCVAGSVIFVSRNRSCLLSARKAFHLCLSPECSVCTTLLGHLCAQPDASYLKTHARLQVSCME